MIVTHFGFTLKYHKNPNDMVEYGPSSVQLKKKKKK